MACRFQSPTIVGWTPCFVANCAVVSSPRSASSATFALNSTEYRCRLLVIQVRPSQERTELKPLSKFAVPPQWRPGLSLRRQPQQPLHTHFWSAGEADGVAAAALATRVFIHCLACSSRTEVA